MTRALSSTWRSLATWLTAMFVFALTTGTALAGKPTVAILGLEVTDSSGNIDQVSTQVAKELTEGMRGRAKSGTGPYQLVAGGDKELIDEKLINNCETEAVPCMATIGENLGAEYLIYGRLEKKTDGYVVTINLLNVKKKKFEKAKTPLVIQQKDPAALQAAAAKAYNDLAGVSSSGTLVVTANADSGTVFLDDENRGTLTGGSATISGLKENRYRLVVEAGGKRSPEVVVTIRSGETTTQPVTMPAVDTSREITGTVSSGGGSGTAWKVTFFTSAAVTVGGAALWILSRESQKDAAGAVGTELEDGVITAPTTWVSGTSADGFCGDSSAFVDGMGRQSTNFQKACDMKDRTMYGAIGVGVGVVGMAIGYFVLRNTREAEARPVGVVGQRARKRPFSVTPVVSAEGGGATFRIDW